jgi:Na+-transporting methylmalonyl-CoA/oxaloacetate decarboxylase beta subunit
MSEADRLNVVIHAHRGYVGWISQSQRRFGKVLVAVPSVGVNHNILSREGVVSLISCQCKKSSEIARPLPNTCVGCVCDFMCLTV